ncbi:hypothetical protein [Actinoallomurus sp. NPDC052274]|uniref:hypothetical protein n=1 Tax=Actinoallomurus sp. NPDC052274 TaxID=3155420 RepID=UPI0034363BC1
MRLRTALAGAGLAGMAVVGVGVPAQAASWQPYGVYGSYKACVDAGQQYVRENFNAYKCTTAFAGYQLWLK